MKAADAERPQRGATTQSVGAIADSRADYRSHAPLGNAVLDAPRPPLKVPD